MIKYVQCAEKALNRIESSLEDMSSEILNRKPLTLIDKRLAEEVLIMSEEVASACDELRAAQGKNRIQTEVV